MTEYLVRVRKVGGEHRATVRQVSGVVEYKPMPGSLQTAATASTAPAAILAAFLEARVPEVAAPDRKQAA